jgi:hypothetical protein
MEVDFWGPKLEMRRIFGLCCLHAYGYTMIRYLFSWNIFNTEVPKRNYLINLLLFHSQLVDFGCLLELYIESVMFAGSAVGSHCIKGVL